MKLFFIRHGQTVANADQTYSGHSDVPLSEQGRREAEALRSVLADIPFDRVYSSDLSRAIDTQRLALPGVEGIRTTLLREYDVGALAGRAFGDPPKEFTGDMAYVRRMRDYTPFGGENAQMVRARLKAFLAQLEADPCENVAVFAHGGLMSCMLQIVLDAEIAPTAIAINNCCINVFDFNVQRWRLLAWNYRGSV